MSNVRPVPPKPVPTMGDKAHEMDDDSIMKVAITRSVSW